MEGREYILIAVRRRCRVGRSETVHGSHLGRARGIGLKRGVA